MGFPFTLITPDHLFLGIATFACFLSYALWIRITRNKRLPLPPGPKPWPIIGNISDFPNIHEGRFWAKHKEQYG